MQNDPVHTAASTNSFVEHIDIATADGLVRFHVIRRQIAPDGIDDRYDTDLYRGADVPPSFFRKLFGTAKSKLLFWR
ncbi:MAG: hypothetical protein IPO19_22205 [Rhodoferax sp.]|nr:hypothetical protein [Rhodoferax sp.]